MKAFSLELTPLLGGSKAVLLRATDAMQIGQEGRHAVVPREQAHRYLDRLRGPGLMLLRDFVARVGISSLPVSSLDDTGLLAMVRGALKAGQLVLLRQEESSEVAPGSTGDQRRLVRDIAAQLQRPFLVLGGRQHRLMADVDLARMSDRNSYEVVGRQEAAKVLQGVAGQPGATAALQKLLDKASGLLSRDWRPPIQPDGLVLLRKLPPSPTAAVSPEAAVTPSQLKKLMVKTEWIEIVLKDELGKPYTGPYEIEVPDGSKVAGNFDDQGMWADYDIDPGTCKLILPDIPEQAKPGTPETWISIKLVDEDGNPMTGYSYTLALTDGSEQKGETSETEIRADDIDPGTCTLSFEQQE